MRVLENGVMAAVKSGGTNVEALLVGNFVGSDQARGVASARGGDSGIEGMGGSVAEGDARRSALDELLGRAFEHGRLRGHVGWLFYTVKRAGTQFC